MKKITLLILSISFLLLFIAATQKAENTESASLFSLLQMRSSTEQPNPQFFAPPLTNFNEIDDLLQVSDMTLEDRFYDANDPAIAYNADHNEYLLVWLGNTNEFNLPPETPYIIGQRFSATDATPIGNSFPISTGSARNPQVVYNPTSQQYLVVWAAIGAGTVGEIMGRRIEAFSGNIIGDPFQISNDEATGDPKKYAQFPKVAYNSANNEYYVVWVDGVFTSSADDESDREIYAQRLSSTGGKEGSETVLSDMGNGSILYDAARPNLSFNSNTNQYLVVWDGDDNTRDLVDDKLEVYGVRVEAASGAKIGNQFRLTNTGADTDATRWSVQPLVTYNSNNQEFYLVFGSDDNNDGNATLADDEYEVFGKRLNGTTGLPITNSLRRLSELGMDGNVGFLGIADDVLFNATANEYFVVWTGADDSEGMIEREFEAFGQRINANNGEEIGADIRLSRAGGSGNTDYIAFVPQIAYNSQDNKYLVVWYADDNRNGQTDEEREIGGQEIAADGSLINENIRLTYNGQIEGAATGYSAVAYNSVEDEFLVVWTGFTQVGDPAASKTEVFARRYDAATRQPINSQFRISDVGETTDAATDAVYLHVTYNPTLNQYLVVWVADDTGTDNENEVFGQLLDGTGKEIGINDFRISSMGPDDDQNYDAFYPKCVYNATYNEYLVVWEGEHDQDGLVMNENEIFGQLVSASGNLTGNMIRISDAGPDGNGDYDAGRPSVVWNATELEYLVVWAADEDITGTSQKEIFGQRLDFAGQEIGLNDFQISDVVSEAKTPVITLNTTTNEYLVIWEAADNPTNADEIGFYGQRLNRLGTEIGMNDFEIAIFTEDPNPFFTGEGVGVVYNATAEEYLFTYNDLKTPNPSGSQTLATTDVNSNGIFLNGTDGQPKSESFLLIEPDNDLTYDNVLPNAAYGATQEEYFVILVGDIKGISADDQYEVFGKFITPIIPLPLVAVNLTAQTENNDIRLDWRINTNSIITNIQLEHSENGIDFQQLTTFNKNNPLTTYLHQQPQLGEHYYRLKLLLENGQVEYSQLAHVQLSAEAKLDLQLFPNPTQSQVAFQLPTHMDVTLPIRVQVYNSLGQRVLQRNLNEPRLDIQQLPQGVYVIEVQQGEKVVSGQIVKK